MASVVRSFSELHEVLCHFMVARHRWMFRGQASKSWQLVPKAGRGRWAELNDLGVFNGWKRRAVEYASALPKTDWDWLAVAQHHGLTTRLLDWSFNPLAGAYFAVTEPHDDDAVVYAFHPKMSADNATEDIGSYTGIASYRPRGVAQRISRQSAVFTVHGPPTLDLKEMPDAGELQRVIIDTSCRLRLVRELDFYGVNRLSLFPDLDGLSAYANWYYESGFNSES